MVRVDDMGQDEGQRGNLCRSALAAGRCLDHDALVIARKERSDKDEEDIVEEEQDQ